ncbi:MAG TPA: flagellin [Kofleriaceae bacterium]|nr:flagellin [Kofleriaceae bacterium]
MRITGHRILDLAAQSTLSAQSKVADVQNQLTSGERVTTPSDDPTAWVAAQRTKLRQVMSQGTGAAVAANRDALEVTDNSLASIGSVVAQVRELAVQASSDTYNAQGRAGLAAQVQGLFQSAVDSANARAPDGSFVLAGSNSLSAPFDTAGVYTGDAAQRAVASNSSAQTLGNISIAGASLTAAHGVDVLPLLGKVATALAANDTNALRATLPDLETAIKQVSTARSQAGGAINVLDATNSARTTLEANMTDAISRFTGVDTVASASELAQAGQSLQVSQAVTTRLIQLLAPSN